MENLTSTREAPKLILLCSDVDFQDYPFGGILSLLKDYLRFMPTDFVDRVILIGITTQKDKVGREGKRRLGSRIYRYLPVAFVRPKSGGSIRLSYNLGVIRSYFKIRKLRPDVLYAHSNESGLLLKLLFPTKRVVVHFHNLENIIDTCKFPVMRHSFLAWLYDLLCVKLLILIVDKIIVNTGTRRFKNLIGSYGAQRSKFIRIPPVINPNVFSQNDKAPIRSQLGFDQHDDILVFHGRLVYPKGVDLVLSAFRIVAERLNNNRLLIIGDGPEKNALVEQSRDWGLRDRVIFTGSIPREKVGQYLTCADIFVTGTHFEAISVALLEALGCGLPVVTPLVGGVGDIVENGYNGFCLDTRTPEEMAQKIILCLGMDRNSLRRNALKTAERFYPENIIPQVLKVLIE